MATDHKPALSAETASDPEAVELETIVALDAALDSAVALLTRYSLPLETLRLAEARKRPPKIRRRLGETPSLPEPTKA